MGIRDFLGGLAGGLFGDDGADAEDAEPDVSGKHWTGSRWEVDGQPISYRVTWRDIDTGTEHSEEFTDIDNGFDFYQHMKKSRRATGATWEHLDGY